VAADQILPAVAEQSELRPIAVEKVSPAVQNFHAVRSGLEEQFVIVLLVEVPADVADHAVQLEAFQGVRTGKKDDRQQRQENIRDMRGFPADQAREHPPGARRGGHHVQNDLFPMVPGGHDDRPFLAERPGENLVLDEGVHLSGHVWAEGFGVRMNSREFLVLFVDEEEGNGLELHQRLDAVAGFLQDHLGAVELVDAGLKIHQRGGHLQRVQRVAIRLFEEADPLLQIGDALDGISFCSCRHKKTRRFRPIDGRPA